MALTKRLERNMIYTVQSALANHLDISHIKLAETRSQRIGPKIETFQKRSKSKLASKLYNTFYTEVGLSLIHI